MIHKITSNTDERKRFRNTLHTQATANIKSHQLSVTTACIERCVLNAHALYAPHSPTHSVVSEKACLIKSSSVRRVNSQCKCPASIANKKDAAHEDPNSSESDNSVPPSSPFTSTCACTMDRRIICRQVRTPLDRTTDHLVHKP